MIRATWLNFSTHAAHNLVAHHFDEFVCKPRGQIRRGGMANGKNSMNEPTSAIPTGTLSISPKSQRKRKQMLRTLTEIITLVLSPVNLDAIRTPLYTMSIILRRPTMAMVCFQMPRMSSYATPKKPRLT